VYPRDQEPLLRASCPEGLQAALAIQLIRIGTARVCDGSARTGTAAPVEDIPPAPPAVSLVAPLVEPALGPL